MLQMINPVQDKRDYTWSQALSAMVPEISRRKKPSGRKYQRGLNHDDMLEAVKEQQTRSEKIIGKD